jgi:hypothetical protein
MGGAEAWNNTRFLQWRMFGRNHSWDKWTGDYKYEDDSLVVLMNVNTRDGRVWKHGQPIEAPDTASMLMGDVYARWINDSYWLIMPYKLQDPGVRLIYLGARATEDGREADVLEMTFDNVGLTPENKYHVFVDRESHLVSQWSFFRNASDEAPLFTRPWGEWSQYGDIWLSTRRNKEANGPHRITDLTVSTSLPEGAFDKPEATVKEVEQ